MLQASAMHELPQLRVQAHNALDREEAVHDAARHRNPRTVLVVGISNRSLDPGSSLRRASSPCQAVATQTFGARSSTPLPSSWRCRPVAWRGGWSSSPARAAPHHNTTATAVATVEDCRAHTHTHTHVTATAGEQRVWSSLFTTTSWAKEPLLPVLLRSWGWVSGRSGASSCPGFGSHLSCTLVR